MVGNLSQNQFGLHLVIHQFRVHDVIVPQEHQNSSHQCNVYKQSQNGERKGFIQSRFRKAGNKNRKRRNTNDNTTQCQEDANFAGVYNRHGMLQIAQPDSQNKDKDAEKYQGNRNADKTSLRPRTRRPFFERVMCKKLYETSAKFAQLCSTFSFCLFAASISSVVERGSSRSKYWSIPMRLSPMSLLDTLFSLLFPHTTVG